MKRILILANNDVGLYKFRKELIIELLKEYEVFVSLPYGSYVDDLISLGCKFVETDIERRGTNPVRDMKLLLEYRSLIKKIKPSLVLTYTIKPNIYGGSICRQLKVPYISNITGLGTAVENEGILQRVILNLYKYALKSSECVFFQNKANFIFFENANIAGKNKRIIPGSGVNVDEHKYEEFPINDKIVFTFIGRIMKDKGIEEFLFAASEMCDIEKDKYIFQLVGEYDENYKDIVEDYHDKGIIKYLGFRNDIHEIISRSNCIVLPSYHEGLSNVLLESASTGRPVITCNVPGCQETFDEGISGFGCQSKSKESLFKAVEKFSGLSYSEMKLMGLNGRKKIEEEFNRKIVVEEYLDMIERI